MLPTLGCIWDVVDLQVLVEVLRKEGGNLPGVEVKSAGGGYPESLVSSLCALANRPGGGVVILGLDETTGFTPVPLSDARRLKEALASQGRHALDPPIVIEASEAFVDGVPVVVGIVPEVDRSVKPCRVAGGTSRGVWLRALDGDYRASGLEPANVRKHLRRLRTDGHITQRGGKGQPTTYERT